MKPSDAPFLDASVSVSGTPTGPGPYKKMIACPLCLKKFPKREIDKHVTICGRKQKEERKEDLLSSPITKAPNIPIYSDNRFFSTLPPSSIVLSPVPSMVHLPSSFPPTAGKTSWIPEPEMSQQARSHTFSPQTSRYSSPSGTNNSPSSSHKSPKRSTNWAPIPKLKQCPVFRPTEQEFKDPMKYIASIREKGAKFGIVKIVPPSDKWLQGKSFSKLVNNKNFIFPTKLQSIHQLQTRNGPCSKFIEELENFLEKRGTPLKIPILDGQELDLYNLYHAVLNRGGLQQVIQNKKWKAIARELRLSSEIHNVSHFIKQSYYKYLYPYELNQKARREHKHTEDSLIEESLDTLLNESLKDSSDEEVETKIEEEFGYDDGRMFTLTSFKKMATAFKKKWFGTEDPPPSDVENAYWKIVETSEEAVQVHYGSDLEVSTYGSGFPREAGDLRKASGWNLNKFPKLDACLLSHLTEDISGVIQPMMYIGMTFSTFCWHTEDNYLYSINYLHHGAPKTWYGIPEYAAVDFEKIMRKTVPDLFQIHRDLLFQLTTMISPRILIENGVPVYRTLQQAGEFMITFPKAYHAGFSHGFNCAESSNFALDDWFSFGRESVQRYRHYARSSVFSFEELLCNAALGTNHPPVREVVSRLKVELPLMKKREESLRKKVLREGVWKCLQFSKFEGTYKKTTECSICKYDCYLSALVCPCNPSQLVCLDDSDQLCQCDPKRKFLLFRHKLFDIDAMISRIEALEAEFLMKEANENTNSSLKQVASNQLAEKPKPETKLKRPHTNEPLEPRKLQKLARQGGIKQIPGVQYDLETSVDEDMFILEQILDSRTCNGKEEYLIKWQGFPASEGTWENVKELCCFSLIEAYNSYL